MKKRVFKKCVFISHISEDGSIAKLIKSALGRDFLGLLNVFVSSDTESIVAGEEWLRSVEEALGDCTIFVILCSPESIRRPWINFETGAAWMRKIPIIPLCHSGLQPRDLPMPLSLRQGIALNDSDGLRRFYARVAKVLNCDAPSQDFNRLAGELAPPEAAQKGHSSEAIRDLDRNRGVQERLTQALNNPKWEWRSLKQLAIEAAVSEEKAADLLRADARVRFGKNKSLGVIVGLRTRVG